MTQHRIFKLPMAAVLEVLAKNGAEEVAAEPHKPVPQTAPKKQSYVLSYKELKSLKGIPYSRQHLYRLEEAGAFPKRIRIGAKIGWYEHEIDEWLQSKADAR